MYVNIISVRPAGHGTNLNDNNVWIFLKTINVTPRVLPFAVMLTLFLGHRGIKRLKLKLIFLDNFLSSNSNFV